MRRSSGGEGKGGKEGRRKGGRKRKGRAGEVGGTDTEGLLLSRPQRLVSPGFVAREISLRCDSTLCYTGASAGTIGRREGGHWLSPGHTRTMTRGHTGQCSPSLHWQRAITQRQISTIAPV